MQSTSRCWSKSPVGLYQTTNGRLIFHNQRVALSVLISSVLITSTIFVWKWIMNFGVHFKTVLYVWRDLREGLSSRVWNQLTLLPRTETWLIVRLSFIWRYDQRSKYHNGAGIVAYLKCWLPPSQSLNSLLSRTANVRCRALKSWCWVLSSGSKRFRVLFI